MVNTITHKNRINPLNIFIRSHVTKVVFCGNIMNIDYNIHDPFIKQNVRRHEGIGKYVWVKIF